MIKFSSEQALVSANTESSNSLLGPLATETSWNVRSLDYLSYAEQVIQVVQQWPPTYMPYSSPIIGGLVIGPAAVFLRAAIDRRRSSNAGNSSPDLDGEILKLCLTHFSRFWKIGKIFLGTCDPILLAPSALTPIKTLQNRYRPEESPMTNSPKLGELSKPLWLIDRTCFYAELDSDAVLALDSMLGKVT